MASQYSIPALVCLAGVGLVLFGFVGGNLQDTGGEYFVIQETVPPDEIPNDATVVEYGNVSQRIQTAFDEARTSQDNRYRFDEFPTDLEVDFIHYNSQYYRVSLLIATNSGGEYFIPIWGGVLLTLLGLAWGGYRFKTT